MSDDFEFDRHKVRRSFGRAAESYDEAAALQNEVANRLLERLEYVRHMPEVVLDMGAGTGYCSEKLLQKYPKSRLIASDFAEGMLYQARRRGRLWRRPVPVCADAGALPFKSQSVDLIFSSLMLQWCHPVDRYLAEFNRVLKPGGLLMFSTLGPDTLKELKASWRAVDQGMHVHGFLDMHDVGDAMVGAGLLDPVLDVETITLQYGDVIGLLRDLKGIGANNAVVGRSRGLSGRSVLNGLSSAYEQFRGRDGRLPATYEVVFGHAWRANSAAGVSGKVFPIIPQK